MTQATPPDDAGCPALALRPLRADDAALFVDVYTDDTPHLGPVDAARARQLFARARDGGGDFFVVLADGREAGIAGLVPGPDGCREAGLVLAPAWRRRGLGTRVFARLIAWALADRDGDACIVRHAAGHPAMPAIAARLALQPMPAADGIAWTATR